MQSLCGVVILFVFNSYCILCPPQPMRVSAPWRPRLRQIVQQKSKYVWKARGPGRMLVFGLGNLPYPKTRHRCVLFRLFYSISAGIHRQNPIASLSS